MVIRAPTESMEAQLAHLQVIHSGAPYAEPLAEEWLQVLQADRQQLNTR